MFGQVLDKLDAWVGRSFLLASFFPFLIFLAANAMMAQFMTPDAAKYAISYFEGGVYGPINTTVTCLAAAAAFAYVTDPLSVVMTRFLEGAYFPPRVAAWLATDQTKKVRDLEEGYSAPGKMRAEIVAYKKRMTAELKAANDSGVAIGDIRDPTLIGNAQDEIAKLEQKQDMQQPILLGELETAAVALQAALAKNCADTDRLAAGATESDKNNSQKLRHLFTSMVRTVDYAHKKIVNNYSLTVYEKQMNFPPIELPTEFGNHAAALRSLISTSFGPSYRLSCRAIKKRWTRLPMQAEARLLHQDILIHNRVHRNWLIIAAVTAERELVVFLIGTAGFLIAALWLENRSFQLPVTFRIDPQHCDSQAVRCLAEPSPASAWDLDRGEGNVGANHRAIALGI